MAALDMYHTSNQAPSTEAHRVGALLGLRPKAMLDDIGLAERIEAGLRAASADALGAVIGRARVVGPLIPEATLRRARKERKALSREMSERLYEVSRVVDAVSRIFHGDQERIDRFLAKPHPLLAGKSPIAMAGSSSAGANAVLNLLQRAEGGFAL
jgi:putative toxin-antitoxin system antitoxin component (TIGR02293 family)